MTEQITGKLIPTTENNEIVATSPVFQFNDIEISPYPLTEGCNYIITSWNSNTYIIASNYNRFDIKEHHGVKLQVDKDYIIIKPRF